MNQVNGDGYRLWDLSADPAAHERHLSLAEAIRLYGKREPVVKDPSGGECLHCGSVGHQVFFCIFNEAKFFYIDKILQQWRGLWAKGQCGQCVGGWL